MIKCIYKAEKYYLKTNSMKRALDIIFIALGIALAVNIGKSFSYQMDSLLFPLNIGAVSYIFLYFLIALQSSMFYPSNFESGSIKNIIPTCSNRNEFIFAKLMAQVELIFKWLILTQVSVFITYFLLAVFNKTINLYFDWAILVSVIFNFFIIFINFFSISTIVLYFSLLSKNSSTTMFLTIAFVVGDAFLHALLVKKASELSIMLSEKTYWFSVLQIVNNMPTEKTIVSIISLPIAISVIFLFLSVFKFSKQDIK